MDEISYEPEYLAGIDHFNAHEFFEAHEVWEDIWARTSGTNQLFYKGLIHAAVALHHYGNGNLHGARKVWGSCRQYLAPYGPRRLGLDVARFLECMQTCFGPLEQPQHAAGGRELIEDRIPTITLDPAAELAEHES